MMFGIFKKKKKERLYKNKFDDKTICFYFVPTIGCNLRCSYCFQDEAHREIYSLYDHFTPDQWARQLGHYSDFNVELNFTGGEPFLRKETNNF